MRKKRFYIFLDITAILIVGLLYYKLIAEPTFNELDKKYRSEFLSEMKINRILIDNLVSGYLESGRSISSRTMIRKSILDYKAGDLSLNQLKKFTKPKYFDGINALNDCIYAARIVDGITIVEYGDKTIKCIQDNKNQLEKLETCILLKDSTLIVEIISPINQNEKLLGIDDLIFKETKTVAQIFDEFTNINIVKTNSLDQSSMTDPFVKGENLVVSFNSIIPDYSYEFSKPKSLTFQSLENFKYVQVLILSLLSIAILVTLIFFQLRTRLVFTTRSKYLETIVDQKTDELQSALLSLELANKNMEEQKEKYRVILENSSDFVYWISPNNEFTYISPNAEQLTGYTQDEFYKNPTLYKEIIHPDDLSLFEKHRDIRDEKGNVKPIEFRIIKKDSSISWMLHSCKEVYSANNVYQGIRGGNKDITEKKLVELELKNNREELKKSNKTKDKLFSIISHDLKNPFQSLLGITRALEEMPDDFSISEIHEFGKKLNTSSQNIFNLLDNLLKWASLQQGNLKHYPEKLYVSEVILEAVNTAKVKAEQKNISINYETDLSLAIFADNTMISSVLLNLLTNAIKFTNRGGTIRVAVEPTKNNFVQISVIDSGVGIPKAKIEKLFKVGEKIGTTGTEGELSSGLGLLLCSEFIELHGGKIWAESEVGKGSKFIFTLPIA